MKKILNIYLALLLTLNALLVNADTSDSDKTIANALSGSINCKDVDGGVFQGNTVDIFATEKCSEISITGQKAEDIIDAQQLTLQKNTMAMIAAGGAVGTICTIGSISMPVFMAGSASYLMAEGNSQIQTKSASESAKKNIENLSISKDKDIDAQIEQISGVKKVTDEYIEILKQQNTLTKSASQMVGVASVVAGVEQALVMFQKSFEELFKNKCAALISENSYEEKMRYYIGLEYFFEMIMSSAHAQTANPAEVMTSQASDLLSNSVGGAVSGVALAVLPEVLLQMTLGSATPAARIPYYMAVAGKLEQIHMGTDKVITKLNTRSSEYQKLIEMLMKLKATRAAEGDGGEEQANNNSNNNTDNNGTTPNKPVTSNPNENEIPPANNYEDNDDDVLTTGQICRDHNLRVIACSQCLEDVNKCYQAYNDDGQNLTEPFRNNPLSTTLDLATQVAKNARDFTNLLGNPNVGDINRANRALLDSIKKFKDAAGDINDQINQNRKNSGLDPIDFAGLTDQAVAQIDKQQGRLLASINSGNLTGANLSPFPEEAKSAVAEVIDPTESAPLILAGQDTGKADTKNSSPYVPSGSLKSTNDLKNQDSDRKLASTSDKERKNIFEIVSNRYVKSAYPSLLDYGLRMIDSSKAKNIFDTVSYRYQQQDIWVNRIFSDIIPVDKPENSKEVTVQVKK